jgi:hypothetical protein
MSPLFRDLVTSLMSVHCIVELVAELDDRESIEQRLQALAPELALIGLRAGEGDGIGRTLSGAVPGARLIAFSSDNRHAFVHQLHRPRRILLDFSPRQLIDTALGRDG